MELRHLRYFIAVAEERHFTRAAQRLGIAQPALSQQIKQLEAELGFKLLDRTKQRVELLEAGEVFLREARRTLAQAERAVRASRRAHEGKVGRLVVGFVGSSSLHLLPEVLQAYRRDYPEVDLELRELTSAEQQEALRQGRIDVGLLRPFPPDDALVTETVLREPLVAALPHAHPLAGQTRISVGDLRDEDFIIFPRHLGPDFYDLLTNLCRRAGFNPNVVQEAVQMTTIVSLVAGGLGAALVPASVSNMRRVGTSYVPLEDAACSVDLALAWRKDDRSPVLGAFVRVVRSAVGNTAPPLPAGF